MTSSQLLDAMDLLPQALLAETDALRCRPRRLRWQPYAAAAAAALVVICAGAAQLLPGSKGASAQNTAMAAAPEEAPMAQSPALFSGGTKDASAPVRYAATPALSAANGSPAPDASQQAQAPAISLIASVSDWEDYRRQLEGRYQLEQLDTLMQDYDQSFFESQDLVLIALYDSTCPMVTGTAWEQETFVIQLQQSQDGQSPSCWHIALAAEKGTLQVSQIQLETHSDPS